MWYRNIPHFSNFNFSQAFWGPLAGFPVALVSVLLTWGLVWKGIALWKSARHEQKAWFILLLIINSVGVLPIIYLAFFQKKGKKK